jgi:hypothetical protein
MNVNWKDWKVWLGLGIFVAVLVGLAIYDLLRRRRAKKALESFKASGHIQAEKDAALLPPGTIRLYHRESFPAMNFTEHKAGRYSTDVDFVNKLTRLRVPQDGSLIVAPGTGVTFVGRPGNRAPHLAPPASIKPSSNGVAIHSIKNMTGRISRICIYTQGNEPVTC